jgi:hypothetical protein
MTRALSLTLALDIGTSSAKVALFDARGRRRLLLREGLTLRRLAGGGVEQDPEDYVRAAGLLLRRAAGRLPASARVARAGFTCQRSTVVVWDAPTGVPRPAVTWMDRRAARLVARLERHAGLIARRTGLRLSAHYGAAHLARRFFRGAGAPARGGARHDRRRAVSSFVPREADRDALRRALRSNAGAALVPLRPGARSLGSPPLRALRRAAGVPAGGAAQRVGVGRPRLRRPNGARARAWRGTSSAPPPRSIWTLSGRRRGRRERRRRAQISRTARAALVHYGTGSVLPRSRPRPARHRGRACSSRRGPTGRASIARAPSRRPGTTLDAVAEAVGPRGLRAPARRGAPRASCRPRRARFSFRPSRAGRALLGRTRRARSSSRRIRQREALVRAALLGIAHRVTDCLDAAGGAARQAGVVLSGPLASIAALVQLQADLSGRSVRVALEPEATLLGIARIATRAHGAPPIPPARAGRPIGPRTSRPLRRALRGRWRVALAASRDPSRPRLRACL